MVPRVKRVMTRKISKKQTVEPSKMSKNETVKPSKISKNKRVEPLRKSKNQTVEPPDNSEYQSEYICNFNRNTTMYNVCTLGVSPSLVSRYCEGYSFL